MIIVIIYDISFIYYMNCCQEVKQRIAMAKKPLTEKEAFFCGPLEKELRKRLVIKERGIWLNLFSKQITHNLLHKN